MAVHNKTNTIITHSQQVSINIQKRNGTERVYPCFPDLGPELVMNIIENLHVFKW